MTHPLNEVFEDAVGQAAEGKGQERHGMGQDFYEQKWVRLAKAHGIGFLTGQAQKKLEEAMNYWHLNQKETTVSSEWWEREMLGALNYMAMAVLFERNIKNGSKGI